MSGFMRNMFGGSESSQRSQSIPIDMTPQAFKELQVPFANFLLSSMFSGGPKYEGPFAAGMGQNEQDVLKQLMGMTGPGSQGAAKDYFGRVMGGEFLNGNPFLSKAIQAAQRPTLQGLEETLSRSLPGRFTQAGHMVQPQGSSAFDRAAGVATRGVADAIGDIATKMSFGSYEAERGRQGEAAAAYGALTKQEVDSTLENLKAQALPRMIEDLGIERGLQEFQRRSSLMIEILRMLGGITQPTIGNLQSSEGESVSSRGVIPGLFPGGIPAKTGPTGGK